MVLLLNKGSEMTEKYKKIIIASAVGGSVGFTLTMIIWMIVSAIKG